MKEEDDKIEGIDLENSKKLKSSGNAQQSQHRMTIEEEQSGDYFRISFYSLYIESVLVQKLNELDWNIQHELIHYELLVLAITDDNILFNSKFSEKGIP
ncbi:hypothetical protein X798_06117 [Onchocerca flexuosa]|uniref:Uncharacterized protein n=1 Tax=Onchocerca flexuosa TaxID=387005 RepID=A0A238BQM0_9BILA|nr:hypothetical protein X798_06117 [Onchocerca flexuosa]